jgi:hypothetical protein
MSKMSSSDKLDTRFSRLSSLSGPYMRSDNLECPECPSTYFRLESSPQQRCLRKASANRNDEA